MNAKLAAMKQEAQKWKLQKYGIMVPLTNQSLCEMAEFALEQVGDTDPIPDVVGTVREGK